jgi:uncharacterized membrane protein
VAGQGVDIDKPIEFQAAVVAASSREATPDPPGTEDPAPVDPPIAGKVQMEIIPRGVGRIEIIAANLFQEIQSLERASLELRLRNQGTRTLSNVVITQSLPVQWQGSIEPALVPSLPAGSEEVIRFAFAPPPDVVMGEYVARIHVEAMSAGRQIEHPDVEDRIRVTAPPHYVATAGLFGGLIVLATGAIFMGARLSRR